MNLQPLVWSVGDEPNDLDSKSLTHRYTIMPDANRKFKAAYYELSGGTFTKYATGFATIEDAKTWCWNHYNEKMQPYVKPSPTWISVDDRLPNHRDALSESDKCLVMTKCGKFWMGLYNTQFKPDDWYLYGWTEKKSWHPFEVTHWMPIPEFSEVTK